MRRLEDLSPEEFLREQAKYFACWVYSRHKLFEQAPPTRDKPPQTWQEVGREKFGATFDEWYAWWRTQGSPESVRYRPVLSPEARATVEAIKLVMEPGDVLTIHELAMLLTMGGEGEWNEPEYRKHHLHQILLDCPDEFATQEPRACQVKHQIVRSVWKRRSR